MPAATALSLRRQQKVQTLPRSQVATSQRVTYPAVASAPAPGFSRLAPIRLQITSSSSVFADFRHRHHDLLVSPPMGLAHHQVGIDARVCASITELVHFASARPSRHDSTPSVEDENVQPFRVDISGPHEMGANEEAGPISVKIVDHVARWPRIATGK